MFPWDIVILDPPKTYTQDGVCLTESGMTQLKESTVTVPQKKTVKTKVEVEDHKSRIVWLSFRPPDIQSEHSRDANTTMR